MKQSNERILADIRASWAIEGMNLTSEDEKNIMDVLNGIKTSDDVVKQLVKQYKE